MIGSFVRKLISVHGRTALLLIADLGWKNIDCIYLIDLNIVVSC